jgi:SNF2 family DNA or RNA helicase
LIRPKIPESAGIFATWLTPLLCFEQVASPGQQKLFDAPAAATPARPGIRLHASLHSDDYYIGLLWLPEGKDRPVLSAAVRVLGDTSLEWIVRRGRKQQREVSQANDQSIRTRLKQLSEFHPITGRNFEAIIVSARYAGDQPETRPCASLPPETPPWEWLAGKLRHMLRQINDDQFGDVDSSWMSRTDERREAEEARIQQNRAAAARQQLERERKRAFREQIKAADRVLEETAPKPAPAAPLPAVPVRFEFSGLQLQETAVPLTDLSPFKLQEKAALWWVSNQTDSLLCLPYCRIQRLEYQIRTALRVLGPLRGRALLSDEVGLGKTVEAGLVLKELLTRGMVKRFLILTVPSLVDQWEEELNDKFGLSVATTNRPGNRTGDARFWEENSAIVASLHTLKQPAQLEVARRVKWDLLVVDEAHYLRNRESQAWQAVSALPRQFLLLLTATPVQNSLEELYNLVTLLQPGQLPPPKEFRKRFIDPKRPRRPREPEELRRLLGQVMIRNTRSNAGLKLPPRHAETVMFSAGAGEREFWMRWEAEFRQCLQTFSASQANLWGRFLLQAAGSSPAAWRKGLEKFPDRASARAWLAQSPLEESWARKCQLLIPLTKGEGGVVVFSQFLETQAAIADHLKVSRVPVFVVNGATPAVERQPITEEFRRSGGALLLTHSGTEGRNLQFCHQLVNFDLPWNPMEIEQRIGRLHRFGQQHPVRIHNFTQEGTLQQHLLEVLQEKLNLFELVIGETGLVLGERFDSDEFAEEVLRRWRDNEGKVAEAINSLGEELKAARGAYEEVKELDQTLFGSDYASDL